MKRFLGDATNAEEDSNSLSVGNQARKSAAQQRRRQRKERRSTGLPELRPSDVGGEVSSASSGQSRDLDSRSEVMDIVSEVTSEDDESDVPQIEFQPSSSPRPTRRRRTHSFDSDRTKSPENARPSRKVFRKTEDDDDSDYNALVKRLHERIRRKRPQQSDDDNEKREKVKPERDTTEQTKQVELLRNDDTGSAEKLSFVDMFSFSRKPAQDSNETAGESLGDVTDQSPNNVTSNLTVVSNAGNDVVDCVDFTKAQSPAEESSSSLADTKEHEVYLNNHSVLDEHTPLLHQPQEKGTDVRRRTHAIKGDNSTQSETYSQKEISTSFVETLQIDFPIQEPNPEPALSTVGSDCSHSSQASFWRRFLSMFGCLVIFCGVWKCFSK